MDTPNYRSFVVRAWARHGSLRRASVEAVQDGVRVDLQGEAASRLLASLDEALATGSCEALSAVERLGDPRDTPGDSRRPLERD